MFGRTGHGLLCVSFWALFLLAIGCSNGVSPLGPEQGGASGDVPAGDRNFTEFLSLLAASQHEDYVTIASVIQGFSGGSVSGSVAGYGGNFSITIPAEAFSGSDTLKILVPTDHVPVYQLLPHRNFSKELTVTLDYELWLDDGAFAHGDSCEVFFMNESTEEFERLSPPAIFVADSTASTVSFKTTHFSRWALEEAEKD